MPRGASCARATCCSRSTPGRSQAQLQQAQGDLAQAQAQLAKAQQDVNRFRPLAAQKAVSQQELDNALSAERGAPRRSVDAEQAAVHQARLNLGWTPGDRRRSAASPAPPRRRWATWSARRPCSPTVSQCDPDPRRSIQLSEQEYLQPPGATRHDPAAHGDNLELILADGTRLPAQGARALLGPARST